MDELSKLPPVTQHGARTFGCLVNGKAWVPEISGYIISSPPLKFYYDNIIGGQFAISATLQKNDIDQWIGIGIDSCTNTGIYRFQKSVNHPKRFTFTDYKNLNCELSTRRDSTVVAEGIIYITRFDLPSGIISGTFEFNLSKAGCTTISITNGRFDAKL